MKTISLIVFAVLVLIGSCDKKDQPDDLVDVIKSGTWKISHYMDAGGDKTTDFIGYTFQFNPNGTMTATKNGIVKNGIWSKDRGVDTLVIGLGLNESTNQPLGQLSDHWKTGSFTATFVNLTAGPNSSNMLILQKL